MKRFVTFEGIDGSGKTTIIQTIYETLQTRGYSVVETREPTGSKVGRCVQHCIETNMDPVVTAFTFISDRIIHGKEISKWLDIYDIILCDRYDGSTYAYQGAQLEESMDDPIKWLKALSKHRFPIPDCTILLDIDPREAMQRIKNREELIPFEKISFLKRVRHHYKHLAEDSRYHIIDASQPVQDIVDQCLQLILQKKYHQVK